MAWPPELADDFVPSVRVLYPDLHGVARGKDLHIGGFERTIEPRRSPQRQARRRRAQRAQVLSLGRDGDWDAAFAGLDTLMQAADKLWGANGGRMGEDKEQNSGRLGRQP